MRIPLLTTLLAPGAGGARLHGHAPVRNRNIALVADDLNRPADGVAADAEVLVLAPLPPALLGALAARYTLLHTPVECGDARCIAAIVGDSGSSIDREFIAHLRGLRLIAIHGPTCPGVDLHAATAHRVRVAVAPVDPETHDADARMALCVLANLDAHFRGAPLPSAIV